METLVTVALLLALILSLEILEGAFYSSSHIEIAQKSLIGRFAGVSGTSCLHRCRRNTSCHQAAMQGPDCLLFRNGIESKSNDGEMISVTMLTKMWKVLGEAYFIISIISHTSLPCWDAHASLMRRSNCSDPTTPGLPRGQRKHACDKKWRGTRKKRD